MVADIDAATDHVHVLFYIWLPDGNGTRMSDALVRAAGRGVVCRAIVDDLGSRSLVGSEHWRARPPGGAWRWHRRLRHNVAAVLGPVL